MSTDYHTPITTGAAATAATFEAPLAQLDAGIGLVATSMSQIAAPITSVDAQSSAGQKVVNVTSTTGFAAGMAIFIGNATTNECRVIDTIQAGVSLTVTVNLTNTYAVGQIVSASPTEIVQARAGAANLLAAITARHAFLGFQTILSGTVLYTPTAGATAAFVEAIGAGGGGGSVATAVTNSGAGGGGGGGGYSTLWIPTLAASYVCAVGAGGPGGVAGAANTGTAGGDTTLGAGGALLVAKGGSGGGGDTIAAGPRIAGAGGPGGLAAGGTGDRKFDGQPGLAGLALAAAQALSGTGGMAAGPGGGGGPQMKTQVAGQAGGLYGGGGSGGCALSGGPSVAGGAGANGFMRIWEWK